jgi:hypothetical protein
MLGTFGGGLGRRERARSPQSSWRFRGIYFLKKARDATYPSGRPSQPSDLQSTPRSARRSIMSQRKGTHLASIKQSDSGKRRSMWSHQNEGKDCDVAYGGGVGALTLPFPRKPPIGVVSVV